MSDELFIAVTKLAGIIGKKFVGEAMPKETDDIQKLYKNITYLSTMTPSAFLADRNPTLLSFIRSIVCHKDPNSFQLASIVENIYNLRNNNLVLPHNFVTNLIQTFTSGSKTVTAINGKINSGGSDTTYRSWLQDNSIEIPYTTEDSDIFIDNCGKYIVKGYRVSACKSKSPNVITSCINIPWKINRALQLDSSLKPGTWVGNLTESEIQELMEASIIEGMNDFALYRYNYVCDLFDFLAGSKDMEENIEKEVERLSLPDQRVCEDCSKVFVLGRKRKCDGCGGKVFKKDNSTHDIPDVSVASKIPKYFNIGEALNPNHAKITMLETIPDNPNSLESLDRIAQSFYNQIISKGLKKWITVGADGPPYAILRRLIQMFGYDWLDIRSGMGHLNMNQMKTYFAVAHHICFEMLGKDVLNFKTKKAYDYFLSCNDTHKSWESLEIFLHGTIMEMIKAYQSTSSNASPLGFLTWQSQLTNPTLRFFYDFVLNIGLSIYVQRIGDRSNDMRASHAGRMRFLDMFYAFPHYIYREVEYNELRSKVIMPDQLKYSRAENMTCTEGPGNSKSHQGGDFMLEQRVRRSKMIAPKGQTSTGMWVRVARNLDKVDKIVKNGMSLLNFSESDQYSIRITPIEKEVTKWRAYLRHSAYLHTDDESFVYNINGDLLHNQLRYFNDGLKDYRQLFFREALTKDLQSIRYTEGNMQVASNEILEEICPFIRDYENDDID